MQRVYRLLLTLLLASWIIPSASGSLERAALEIYNAPTLWGRERVVLIPARGESVEFFHGRPIDPAAAPPGPLLEAVHPGLIATFEVLVSLLALVAFPTRTRLRIADC